MQKKIAGEAAKYIVVNGLLFKIAQTQRKQKMDPLFTVGNPRKI